MDDDDLFDDDLIADPAFASPVRTARAAPVPVEHVEGVDVLAEPGAGARKRAGSAAAGGQRGRATCASGSARAGSARSSSSW